MQASFHQGSPQEEQAMAFKRPVREVRNNSNKIRGSRAKGWYVMYGRVREGSKGRFP